MGIRKGDTEMTKSFSIYGYFNSRFYVNNPYGEYTWFSTRAKRDAAVQALEATADAAGLDDPTFARVVRRIRTEAQRDWYDRLIDRGFLRANGIDAPNLGPNQAWGEDLS